MLQPLHARSIDVSMSDATKASGELGLRGRLLSAELPFEWLLPHSPQRNSARSRIAREGVWSITETGHTIAQAQMQAEVKIWRAGLRAHRCASQEQGESYAETEEDETEQT